MPTARQIVPDGAIRAGLNTSGVVIPNHRLVRDHTLTDSVQICTAATQNPKGVSMESIALNVTGDVQVAGKAVIEAGAAVAKGDLLTSDGSGRAIATTTPGNFVIGRAVTATVSGAGDLIEVEMS